MIILCFVKGFSKKTRREIMCKKIFMIMVLTLSMSLAASARSWTLMDDYSEVPSMANPDGARMYGFYNTNDVHGRAFVTLWVHEEPAGYPIDHWVDDFGLNLQAGKFTGDWSSPWGIVAPAGDGFLTPATIYESGMGWIAPESMTVTVIAACYGIGTGSTTVRLVHISDCTHGIIETMPAPHGTNTGCTGTRTILEQQSGVNAGSYLRDNPLVFTVTVDVNADDMVTLECVSEGDIAGDVTGIIAFEIIEQRSEPSSPPTKILHQ